MPNISECASCFLEFSPLKKLRENLSIYKAGCNRQSHGSWKQEELNYLGMKMLARYDDDMIYCSYDRERMKFKVDMKAEHEECMIDIQV